MRFSVFMLTVLIPLAAPSVLDAQDANEQASSVREPVFDIGEVEVPEGSTADVLEFLQDISQLQKDIAADYRTAMSKISAAQAKASKQLLERADDLSDEQFARAASFGLATRVRGIARANPQEQSKVLDLVTRQLKIGVAKGLQRTEISNASTLASYLERYGNATLALEAYTTFAELLKDVKNPSYRRYSESFAGSARRLGLLGNPIDLSGKLVDGSDFDWEAYRGKVVLVDFWATWCGPCIAEAPNVRKNYDLYHDRGFEVVGISLDSKKSALDAYIKKEKVPWVNVFEDGAGWKHPMAVKYGVRAIPTVFLVDRDGKVVSLRARGAELGNQLRRLLTTKADWEKAIARYSEQITPETTDAALISRRAKAYIGTEQWDLARRDWLRAVNLSPQLAKTAYFDYRKAERFEEATEFGLKAVEDKPEDANLWLNVSPFLVLTADEATVRDYCQRMASQFAKTTDARESRLTVKVCSLVPDALDRKKLPREVFIKSIEAPSGINNAWGWSIRAMDALRTGDAKLAIEYVDKSHAIPHVDFVKAANLPTAALAYHQLGDHEAASNALKQAAQVIDRLEANEANKGHHDVLIPKLLYREAEAKINGKATP